MIESKSENNGLALIPPGTQTIFSVGISTGGLAEIRMAERFPNSSITATTIDQRESDSSHITENFHIFDFNLSREEMALIDKQAERGKRCRLKEEDGLGFTDKFDFSYIEY